METLSDGCKMLSKLIGDMPPNARETSKFAYELTKMDRYVPFMCSLNRANREYSNVKDVMQYLSEWDRRNRYLRAVGRKDVRVQLARLERAIENHINHFGVR